jgi:hypothetical protein
MQSQAQMAYWQRTVKLQPSKINSYLPSVMDFTLYEATTKHSTKTMAVGKGMMKLYDNFTNDFLYPNPNILIFAENHDTNRINETYETT